MTYFKYKNINFATNLINHSRMILDKIAQLLEEVKNLSAQNAEEIEL